MRLADATSIPSFAAASAGPIPYIVPVWGGCVIVFVHVCIYMCLGMWDRG